MNIIDSQEFHNKNIKYHEDAVETKKIELFKERYIRKIEDADNYEKWVLETKAAIRHIISVENMNTRKKMTEIFLNETKFI